MRRFWLQTPRRNGKMWMFDQWSWFDHPSTISYNIIYKHHQVHRHNSKWLRLKIMDIHGYPRKIYKNAICSFSEHDEFSQHLFGESFPQPKQRPPSASWNLRNPTMLTSSTTASWPWWRKFPIAIVEFLQLIYSVIWIQKKWREPIEIYLITYFLTTIS